MDKYKTALGLLPGNLKDILSNPRYCDIEEIRLRCGKRPSVFSCGREYFFREEIVTPQEISSVLEKASGASLQAHLNEVREGYLNYKGLRVGLCGSGIYSNNELISIRSFNSVNIRIPHAFSGDVSGLIGDMLQSDFENTLIVSPPGYGKTSLLRELIRKLSSCERRISVVDERNELACVEGGICCFDMGEHTDVLTGVKKAEGAMMLLRGMSPDVIAFDEVSRKADLAALYEIAGCGVKILATAHGRNLASLSQRPLYRALLSEKIFKNIISIELNGKSREYLLERIEA